MSLKSIYTLGASVLSAAAAQRLSQVKSGPKEQARIFSKISSQLAKTSYWRATGATSGMTYRNFQMRIPPHGYEQLAPAVERMKRGEADVLWPGRCAHFAVSSGTTAGRTKFLPITAGMLSHFRKAGLDSLLYYSARTGSASIFRGRHLFLGGSTALTELADMRPHVAYAGDLSGITALNLPGWVEKHLYEPGTEIAQIADWPAKLEAIVRRTSQLNITMLAGIPSWVLILATALRDHA